MNFKECLKRGKIKEFSQGKELVDKEIKTAEDDLFAARKGLKGDQYKWPTIQSYYVMFHAARALLYAKNYRERSHYCLNIAVRHLYVETKQLPVYYVEALQRAKRLREDADYYDDWSKAGAEEMINLSEDFLNKSKNIIQKN